jgi:hypothetical protein
VNASAEEFRPARRGGSRSNQAGALTASGTPAASYIMSRQMKESATELAHGAFVAGYRKSNMSLGADYGVANLGNLDEEV